MPAQFFSTPTSLFIGLRRRRHAAHPSRAGESRRRSTSARLADLEGLLERVRDGRTSPAAASAEIAEIARRPRRYSRKLTYFCWGLASATSAVFLGGSLREVAVAGFVGLVTGLAAFLAERRPAAERLFVPLAAAFAAFTAAVVAAARAAALGLHRDRRRPDRAAARLHPDRRALGARRAPSLLRHGALRRRVW